MSGKNPAFQFYPGDWRADTGKLTPASRGVWIDLICDMWSQVPKGVTAGTVDELAMTARCSEPQLEAALEQFKRLNICNVSTDCQGIVTLTCRRMVRDEKKRVEWKNWQRSSRGKRGVSKKVSGKCQADVMPYLHSSSSCPTDILTPQAPQGGDVGDRFRGLFGELSESGKLPALTYAALVMWMKNAGPYADDPRVQSGIVEAVRSVSGTISMPHRVLPGIVTDAARTVAPEESKNFARRSGPVQGGAPEEWGTTFANMPADVAKKVAAGKARVRT